MDYVSAAAHLSGSIRTMSNGVVANRQIPAQQTTTPDGSSSLMNACGDVLGFLFLSVCVPPGSLNSVFIIGMMVHIIEV